MKMSHSRERQVYEVAATLLTLPPSDRRLAIRSLLALIDRVTDEEPLGPPHDRGRRDRLARVHPCS